MSIDATQLAPNWSQFATELHCPLCEYNLRGLEEPRCPECGFAFSWSELRDAKTNTHPYLFESHRKRNVWSFWKTYTRDCWPRTFWSRVSAAHTINVRRLFIFYIIANLSLLAPIPVLFAQSLWGEITSPVALTPISPPPAPPSLVQQIQSASGDVFEQLTRHAFLPSLLTTLLWPWLTIGCLLIFIGSMRQAKIRKRHLLRVIVYGTDYGFLMLVPLAIASSMRYSNGWPMVIAIWCAVITLYRVYFAYALYLRFHMPFATVFSSQLIVFLIALVVYFRTWTPW